MKMFFRCSLVALCVAAITLVTGIQQPRAEHNLTLSFEQRMYEQWFSPSMFVTDAPDVQQTVAPGLVFATVFLLAFAAIFMVELIMLALPSVKAFARAFRHSRDSPSHRHSSRLGNLATG
jgi:hypothetical protein